MQNIGLSILFCIEIILLLVPATLFFLAIFLYCIFAFFFANSNVTPAFLIVAAVLLVPGYGLYALWWLAWCTYKGQISSLPRRISVGLIIGVMSALPLSFPFLVDLFRESLGVVTVGKHFWMALVLGVGPIMTLMSILTYRKIRLAHIQATH